jgi:hypothetical protein
VSRYVIAQSWGHILEDGTEAHLRWAFDQEESRLAVAQVEGGTRLVDAGDGKPRAETWWADASGGLLDELEDSLKNANPDALDDPSGWGLDEADELPGWAMAGAMPKP